MIAFRDFSSREFGRPEGLDRALVAANEWLQRTGIKPVNIETLTHTSGTLKVDNHEVGLRVWYLIGPDSQ